MTKLADRQKQYESFVHALRSTASAFDYRPGGLHVKLKDGREVCVVPEADWYVSFIIYQDRIRRNLDRKLQPRDARYVRLFVDQNLTSAD